MTRARTRIRRHVLSRQRLTCRILRRWKKHVLAVEETCCVMFSLQSRRTPRSLFTNHIGWWNTALWVKIKMRCIVIHSASAVKPNQFFFEADALTHTKWRNEGEQGRAAAPGTGENGGTK